jgi:hypothetical protein
MGVLARTITGLAAKAPDHTTFSLNATYLKAHRTASSIAAKREAWMFDRSHQQGYEYQAACRRRYA